MEEDERGAALALCYERCLLAADGKGLEAVSFPLLGSGAFGWPVEKAALAAFAGLSSGALKCESVKEARLAVTGAGRLELLRKVGFEIEETGVAAVSYNAGRSSCDGMSPEEIRERL